LQVIKIIELFVDFSLLHFVLPCFFLGSLFLVLAAAVEENSSCESQGEEGETSDETFVLEQSAFHHLAKYKLSDCFAWIEINNSMKLQG
jgi:hypothetical protein